MHAPRLESDATLLQTGRVADSLRNAGFHNEVVKNEFDEPLAVVVRGALELDKVLGSISLHRLDQLQATPSDTEEASIERMLVADTLPLAGDAHALVLPASFLRVIDIAVQAATERSDVLPHRLNGQFVNAREGAPGINAGAHIDYSRSNNDTRIAARPISGLNVHVTWAGSCRASFGLARTSAGIRRWSEAGRLHGPSVCKDVGAPFSDPVELRPGDAVIFQAGPYRKRLPVGHEFITIGQETRRSELYSPTELLSVETILSLRWRLGEDYHLEQLGYAA